MARPLGKDGALDTSLQTLNDALQRAGFEPEEQHWFNPIANVWSLVLRDKNLPCLSSQGKGTTRSAARASALGEFMERASCNDFFAPYYLGDHIANSDFVYYPNEKWFGLGDGELPSGLLDEPTLKQYNFKGNLRTHLLIDRCAGLQERGVCAIPLVRQNNQQTVWFPVNIINNLYAGNGVSAGNSKYEARVQALSEIFERHIKTTILSSGISLPAIPDEVIAEYPTACSTIAALEAKGFKVICQDASLAGKFPLVNVVVINPKTGGCIASFGAHPKFNVALERTLTGMLQGRELYHLSELSSPTFDVEEVAEASNIEKHCVDSSGVIAWELLSDKTDYTFTRWNIEGDTKAEFDHLCALIHKVDMDIYIADYDHLGVYTCRIVVPGMSEIYSVDDLERNNNNAGIALRDRLLDLGSLSAQGSAELLSELEQANLNNHTLVADWIGVLPDEGSACSTLTVAELRCLLAFASGNLNQASDDLTWLLDSRTLTDERMQFYGVVSDVLTFVLDEERELNDYLSALSMIYGKPQLEKALALVEGKQVFADFVTTLPGLQQFAAHQKLLALYEGLQLAKMGKPVS